MNWKEPMAECCEFLHVHEDLVKKVRKEMPPEEQLYDLAELFKVFGDTTRIKILFVLFQSELCVCDIANLLSMTQSAISHQLRILKQMDLVKSRRDGKTIFYSLADSHIQTILGQGMEHVCEDDGPEDVAVVKPAEKKKDKEKQKEKNKKQKNKNKQSKEK